MLHWYKNQKINVKLKVAFTLLGVLTGLVALGGLWTMSILESRVQAAYAQDLPAVSAVKEAGISQLKAMRVLLRVVLAAGDTEEIDKQNKELAVSLTRRESSLI